MRQAFGAHRVLKRLGAVTALLALVAFPSGLEAQSATLTGQVVDGQQGTAVANVEVSLPDLGRSALTEDDGSYRVTGLPAGTHRVQVRALGYATLSRAVTLRAGESTTLNLTLQVTGVQLDELVVTGTAGPVQRRSVGNTVSTIDAADFADSPGTTVSDVLSSRVSGMTAMTGGGETGSSTSIRLRGASSISRSNEPIVYIDGIRINNRPDSIGAQPFTLTQLDLVDPDNIERIEVLKGASATTLYGSEASTGVIQIFTKSGSAGEPRIRFRLSQGMLDIPKNRMPVNATFAGGEILRTDGRDAVTRTGHRQEYAASVGGGGSNVTYYASGSFEDETGAVVENSLQEFGGRLNVDAQISEPIELTGSLGYIDRSLALPGSRKIPNGPFPNALLAFPFASSPERPFGEIFVPISNGRQIDRNLSLQNILAVAGLRFTPSGALDSRLTVGVENFEEEFDYLEPFGVDIEGSTDGEKQVHHDSEVHFTLDFTNNWRTDISEAFSSRLSVGGQLFFDKKQTDFTAAQGFPGPGVETLGAASVITGYGETQSEVWSGGVFLQEQISWRDRLFLTAGLRVDENSAFGENVGPQPYPKVSASYVLSDEEFWNIDFWNTLKLRASYGTAGLAPGPFDAERTFGADSYGDQAAVVPNNIGNPDLKPEKSREFEAGFDATLFNGRLDASVTYFDQKTTDALVPKAFPPSQGFLQSQLVNAGEIVNRGLEVSLRSTVVERESVVGRLGVSLATLDSEVDLAGAGPIRPGYFRYRNYLITGYQPGAFFGTQLDESDPFDIVVGGVADPDDLSGFNSIDQIAVHLLQNEAGNDSLAFLGNSQPDVSGSFSFDLDLFQRLQIRNLFSFQIGSHAHNLTGKLRTELRITEEVAQIQQELADPSTSDSRKRELAEQFSHISARARSNWIEDNDFLRWSEVSAAYSFPPDLASLMGASRVSLVLSAQNLALWTDYSGSDPVSNEAGATNFVRNTDFLQAPLPRRYNAMLRFSF